MSTTARILEDQVIHVKRGRMNGLGFEPAFNSYFDFYISPKYIDPPLLKLEDVSFHLFLRKNLNDRDKSWRMPSIRQMMKRLDVSYSKLAAMMKRLEQAHLLTKESGYRKGEDGENIQNVYILSDPIQTLEEFLAVAEAGAFVSSLRDEWYTALHRGVPSELPCRENRDTSVSEIATPPIAENATYKQTLKKKQTSGNSVWDTILEELKMQVPPKTFTLFLEATTLVSTEGGVATIGTSQAYARDWIENRLSAKLKRSLGVDCIRCVVVEETEV